MILPNEELGHESNHEIRQDRRIYAHTEPAHEVGYYGGVPVPKPSRGEEAVEDVCWKGDNETDEKC